MSYASLPNCMSAQSLIKSDYYKALPFILILFLLWMDIVQVPAHVLFLVHL